MSICLNKLESVEDLSDYLATSADFLENFSNKELIKKVETSKADGSKRIVYKALFPLADILKTLQYKLNELFLVHDAVHGYIKGLSAYTNASRHTGKKTILKTDIYDFFNQISGERITTLFIQSGLKKELAQILSTLCCTGGSLEAGFCIAPIIANAICYDMDVEINNWAVKNNITYTRYSDDMTFSFNERLQDRSDSIPTILKPIEEIISSWGFRLNPLKTKCMFRGEPQYVTGFPVTENRSPSAPNSLKKELKSSLYYIKKHGIKEHLTMVKARDTLQRSSKLITREQVLKSSAFIPSKETINETINRLEGLVSHIYGVEPLFIEKLRKKGLLPEVGGLENFREFCEK